MDARLNRRNGTANIGKKGAWMQQPTWAVVATVDEPSALIISFAAHYLALGAAEVHLFLDRPNPQAEAALAGLPRLRLTVCDAAYWAGVGWRPLLHVGRQSHNAGRAYAATQADFLLHCDCDEFVRDGAALQAELAALPKEAAYLRLQMAERVQMVGQTGGGMFDGLFRLPMDAFYLMGDQIYGADARFLKDGITGHRVGKAVVRSGLEVKMGLHKPDGQRPHGDSAAGRLLHFDGLTRLHFCLKLLRRAHEPPHASNGRHGLARSMQFLALRERVTDPLQREDLISALKNLSAAQMDHLQALQCFDARAFDPQPAAVAAGLRLDLSVAAFDAALKLRYADFLAQHAPDLL